MLWPQTRGVTTSANRVHAYSDVCYAGERRSVAQYLAAAFELATVYERCSLRHRRLGDRTAGSRSLLLWLPLLKNVMRDACIHAIGAARRGRMLPSAASRKRFTAMESEVPAASPGKLFAPGFRQTRGKREPVDGKGPFAALPRAKKVAMHQPAAPDTQPIMTGATGAALPRVGEARDADELCCCVPGAAETRLTFDRQVRRHTVALSERVLQARRSRGQRARAPYAPPSRHTTCPSNPLASPFPSAASVQTLPDSDVESDGDDDGSSLVCAQALTALVGHVRLTAFFSRAVTYAGG